MPRIELPGMETVFLPTFVIGTPDARFSQIIQCRPYKVADDIGMLVYQIPIAESIAWIGFRLHDDAGGDTFVVRFCTMQLVIIAYNVM